MRNYNSAHRLKNIPGFSIDQVANAAGNDPDILRLENLDTDLEPPFAAVVATTSALSQDKENSYLPFIGKNDLRVKIAEKINRQTNSEFYDDTKVVVTCGATEAMLDTFLAIANPNDEFLLTDPTYAGMINRVRLAGGVPRFIPYREFLGRWCLDLEALEKSITSRTKALFLMNPSMPSGAVFNAAEWGAIAKICITHNLFLVYNAAMERILFDKEAYIHPASIDGMQERTIIIGSMSKEYRMIGWRVGWAAGPRHLIDDIAKVHIYNTVTPTGIGQAGALAALRSPQDGLQNCVSEWQRRRDMLGKQLKDYPMIPAAGGWSQLLDVGKLGYDGETASKLLLERGKIAATPMTHWGQLNSKQFVRLVFSNETVKRLSTIRNRVKVALG